MKNIECEERVMLTFEQYTKLLADYVIKDPTFTFLEIENTYLDDNNLSLINNHKMLRIRKYRNVTELTLKIKNKDGDIEITESLDKHPEIDKALDNKFGQYFPITTLKTNRVEIKIDNYLVVIDQNIYNGVIDYDLEIEVRSYQI